MHLKSLTLKGFKSFAKKTTLDFDEGISCVVGPNGSGKSNISDAILWVLGERSAKNIRGDSMQDVIFAGTKAKSKSAMAEVSLCLDNSDGTLNYDFTTIEITRRMYRSGESDYWLNNAPVRRLDVLNILHDSGLGEGTHSIISQGSLDSVLSFDDMQLKSIIEETAGILKHKQKKIKSLKKLEAMQANVDRISDVVLEIERQLAPLKRRAKRAETYLEIKDELADANLKIAVDDHRKAITKKEELQKNVETSEKILKEIEELIEKTNAEISELTEKIQEQNNISTKNDARAKKYSERLSKLESSCLLLNQSRDQLNSSISRSTEDETRLQGEIETLNQSERTDEDHLSQAKKEKEEVDCKIAELQNEIDELQLKIDELNEKISLSSSERTERQKKIDEINDEINERIAEAEGKKAKRRFLEEKKEGLIKSLEHAENTLREKRDQISDAQSLIEDMKNRDLKAKDMTSTCLNARKSAEDALSKARIDLDACKAQLTALEKIAKTQDVTASVSDFVEKSGNVGASDFLMKSIDVDREYEQIVEFVLENFREALVVDDSEIALGVRSEMGDSSPSLTLVLSDDETISDDVTNKDCLLNHVNSGENASAAIHKLLNNVYVCETLEECFSEHKAHKDASFVTLRGEGVYSDGTVKLRMKDDLEVESGVLARKRQIDELKSILEKNEKSVEELTEKVEASVESLSEAQETSLKITQQLAEMQANMQASKSDFERRETELESLNVSLEEVINEINNIDQSSSEEGRLSVEDLRSSLQAQKGALTTLVLRLTSLEEESKELKTQMDEKTKALSAMNPKQAVLVERCDHLSALVAGYVSRRKSLASRIERIGREKQAIFDKIDFVTEMASILSKLATSFESKVSLFDTNNSQAESQMKQMFEQLSRLRELANEKSREKDEIFGKLSELKINLTKVDVSLKSADERISENFEGELMNALSLPELTNREEVFKRACELSEKMKKLGSIDLSARRDYEELQERFDFLNSNLDDIKASISAIEKIDGFIEKRFKEQFSSTFVDVNSNFSEIFQKLFPGGFGELSLTNPDDLEETGVQISANPAGKKIRKISLLSGGEKSLVAMSFLFALHFARKTPFYVLDEVEAALDDTNLVRLLTYIDSMRGASQFIFITHQRRTMEMSDVLFGVSMGSDGITKVISQKLNVDMLDLNETV